MKPDFSELIALVAALAAGVFVLFPFLCFVLFG